MIRDTRIFIQNQVAPPKFSSSLRPPPAHVPKPISSPQPPSTSIPVTIESPPPPVPVAAKKKVETTTKKGAWELQPMAQVEESTIFRKKISSFIQTHDPLISIFLLLPEENSAHRLFLENVSRAITRTFLPASVILYHEKLLYPNNLKNWIWADAKTPGLIDRNRPHISNIESVTIDQSREFSRQPKSNSSDCLGIHTPQSATFFIPVSLLKKKFPEAQPHQLFKTETISIVPLEDLDLYTHDMNYKRALWHTIQVLFRS